MAKNKNEFKITPELQKKMRQAALDRQRGCDHSFNDRNVCEYCGLSEHDFGMSEGNGDPIGIYQ